MSGQRDQPAGQLGEPARVLPELDGDEGVIGRPYTTAGGKNAQVRLQQVGQSATFPDLSWGAYERVSVKRTIRRGGQAMMQLAEDLPLPCPACDGSGGQRTGFGDRTEPCADCGGSGRLQWTNASVQAETLVSGTVAGMLPSFPNGPAILTRIKAPQSAFSARWAAE